MIEAVRGYLLRITAGAFAGAILLAAGQALRMGRS